MFSLFEQREFFDEDGNFKSDKYLKLIEKARKQLRKNNGRNLEVNHEAKGSALFLLGGVGKKSVWEFIHRLGSFLNSGIDLKTSISIIHKQIHDPNLKRIVGVIKDNLENGLPISETLRQYSQHFDPLVIALVDIGEKTGTMPKVIQELDKKLLESIELRSKVKGAMVYPSILMTMTMTMTIFMMTFVIPKIAETFTKSNMELPELTKFIIYLSNFLQNHFMSIIVGLGGFIAFNYLFKKTYPGKLVFGWIALHIPVFGYINRYNDVVLFINSLSLLLDSWVLMLDALTTSASVVNNIYFKRDIIRIKNEVETGIRLSQAMGLTITNRESAFSNVYFTEDLAHMIMIGEETGKISKTIEKVGTNYSKELRAYIGNMTTMLEPFILVFVGAMIGVIVVAIMLPFFNMGKLVKKA